MRLEDRLRTQRTQGQVKEENTCLNREGHKGQAGSFDLRLFHLSRAKTKSCVIRDRNGTNLGGAKGTS